VSVILDKWTAETGLTLSAEGALKEQKVTVRLASQTGSAAVLPAFATLLQARWRISETDTSHWILERLPVVEAGLARQKELALQLQDKVRKEQGALTQRAITRGLEELHRPPRDLGGGLFGRPYVSADKEAEPLIRLLGTLSPDQRQYLSLHPRLSIPTESGGFATDRTPVMTMQFSTLSSKQQGLVREFFAAVGSGVDLTGAVVRFYNTDGKSLAADILLRDGSSRGASLIVMEEGPALTERFTGRPRSKSDAAERVNSTSKAAPDPMETLNRRYPQHLTVEWRDLDYAEAVRRAGEVLKLSIIADYYTQSHRCSLKLTEGRPSDLIGAIAGAFHCAVRWHGDVLLLRSTQWPVLDEREISERLLDDWVELKRQSRPESSSLPLEQLAHIASRLRPEQICCLGDYRSRAFPEISFVWEAQALLQDADVLGFYAALPAASRRKLTANGLTIRGLPSTSQPAILRLLERRASWLVAPGAADGVTVRLLPDTADGERSFTLVIRDATEKGETELRYPTSILDVVVRPLKK
jgi:hypothetical protein